MSQLPKIPASAYTREMETLGALPDIPTFDGEPVLVSRNPLTPETRPLQLLPLPGTEFPVRYETAGCAAFSPRNQVSTFVQSISDDLWQIPPMAMDQLAWLRYFKDLKPNHGFLSWLVNSFNPNTMVFRFEDSEVTPTYEEICAVMDHHPDQDETPTLPLGPRYNLSEIIALCPIYLPDGINVDQGLPLEPFLNKVLCTDLHLPWIRACCFLLLNVYAMKNRQPGRGDFRLLTVVRDMQLHHRTVFMMIIGETMCWVRDIALHITDFNVHHRGCPLLLEAWALDKLSLIPPVPARLIPTYGAAIFQSRSRRRFDFDGNPTIRWTCPWWRIRLVTIGSMNLNYVLYASLDRSMAYFPDRISRQYGMIQRVSEIHNFESGLITQHLLTNLVDRWRDRNTRYLGEGVMQNTVTPEYVNWFYAL
ncbi:hypothetical protein JCGZ_25289 [Jatropha curcas]|uniref:Aminotransferase-like plant mobile domain-containing protein n=1 Tax=Jatropha curcas TaxID=180498 RepID=A0A067JXV1_JATCU|nr:hypothetical protein JCGZ_25289 [Jatropha curcas]